MDDDGRARVSASLPRPPRTTVTGFQPTASRPRVGGAAPRPGASSRPARRAGPGRRHRVGLPLWVWFGALALLCVLVDTAVTALLWERLPSGLAMTGGAAAGALGCAGLTAVAAGHSRTLRDVRADAQRALHDATADEGRCRRVRHREVAQLSEVLAAMRVRVRLADELARRHRREAEQAAAGVFELLSGLVAAEEGVRGQLAAELHDTVAQSLAVARTLAAESLAAEHGDRCASLVDVGEHVQDAEEQLRAVMARARPPALREGDLAVAVGMLADDMRRRYAVEVDVRWPREAHPVPLATATTVYRFFQEGLLNVAKHADVDTALATLTVSEHELVARVCDDGPGFEPSDVRSTGGRQVGLGLLRERARLSGGSLEVTSHLEEGTALELRLPRPVGQPGLVSPTEGR